jgi:hypothetical protein
MILSAITEKLKRRSKNDFEALLILQAVCWYLRCGGSSVSWRSFYRT